MLGHWDFREDRRHSVPHLKDVTVTVTVMADAWKDRITTYPLINAHMHKTPTPAPVTVTVPVPVPVPVEPTLDAGIMVSNRVCCLICEAAVRGRTLSEVLHVMKLYNVWHDFDNVASHWVATKAEVMKQWDHGIDAWGNPDPCYVKPAV
jgi:hypothetical protein